VLLWQTSVATSPLIFVIATCIWSVKIIYLLVNCNKQFFWGSCRSRHHACPHTFLPSFCLIDMVCVKTSQMSCLTGSAEKLLITTYQEVNDLYWSNTCCDDENEWTGGNTSLPEQHFWKTNKEWSRDSMIFWSCSVYWNKKNIILLVSISAETIEDDGCRRKCDVIIVIDFICFLIIENYSIENRVATSSAFSRFFRSFSAVPLFSAFSFFMLFCINNFILLLKIQHRRKPDIIQ
jgi:hypothetical protein